MENEKRLDLIDRNNLENEIKRLEVGNSSLIGKIILSTMQKVIVSQLHMEEVPGSLDVGNATLPEHIDLLLGAYPQLEGKLGNSTLDISKYIYDDSVDTNNVHYNGRGGAKWRVECFDCGYTVDKGNRVRHDAQVNWNKAVRL